MTKLAGDRAEKIKNEKMALSDDRFHIAPEQIENDGVADQMPRAVMQKDGGKKLPTKSCAHATVAEPKIFSDESRLRCLQKNLRTEGGDVDADQAEQDY